MPLKGLVRLLLGGLLILTGGLYAPGLDGPFLFDDQQNILRNPSVHIETLNADTLAMAWAGNSSGPLGRPIASVSFALNHAFSGLDERAFKTTNVALHLISGLLLYLFLSRLLAAARLAGTLPNSLQQNPQWLPLIVCALWLLHPFHVSTVLYVVQRMAILSTLFSLAALAAYCHYRARQLEGRSAWAGLLILPATFTVLASLSKESGLLTPLYCLAAELTLFRLKAARDLDRKILRIGCVSAVAVGALMLLFKGADILAYFAGGYVTRPFSLEERLLTQARVLCWYLQMIVAPSITSMGFYHDHFPVSTSLTAPITTAFSIVFIAGSLLLALLCARRLPLVSFGILFFFLGHLLESSVIALELVFEHRNYAPSIGPLLILATLATALAHRKRGVAVAAVATMLMAFAALLGWRAWVFGDEHRLLTHALQHHPHSPRTQLWAGDTYRLLASTASDPGLKQTLYTQALVHYGEATALDPGDVIGLYEWLEYQYATDDPKTPETTTALYQRLAHSPPSASMIYSTQHLVRDISGGVSHIPLPTADAAIDALLTNQRLRGARRGAVLALQGDLATTASDPERALVHYQHALRFRPNDALILLKLTVTYMASGDVESAKQSLGALRQADHGAFREAIALIEEEMGSHNH